MTTRSDINSILNRRRFLAGAAAVGRGAGAAIGAGGRSRGRGRAQLRLQRRPHRMHHLQLPRRRSNTAEDTLKALLEDGLSETELMDGADPRLRRHRPAAARRRASWSAPKPTDAELAKVRAE